MRLTDIYIKFPTQNDCLTFLEKARWSKEPLCPICGYAKFSPVGQAHKYHCNLCNRTFTVTSKTIFHKTKLDLQKWFYAIIVTIHPLEDKSVRDLATEIGVAKDTAWGMQKKIKQHLVTEPQLLQAIDKTLDYVK
ncbi:MAG: IS1595 family transposase [Chitinophagales bacterium]|nr:IS1595 family transposase [Chitinophagales bacterium]